jgi:uncharacterized membrane protein
VTQEGEADAAALQTQLQLHKALDSQWGWASGATALLWVALVVDAVAAASSFVQLDVLEKVAKGVPGFHELATSNDSRQQMIGYLQILVLIVTGIVFLRWVHQACRALTLVGTGVTRFTPGWAVGYWFVPFVNLVRPYQILKDIWQRSNCRNALASMEAEPVPKILGLWWGCRILSALLARAASGQAAAAKTTDDFSAMTNTLILTDLLGVIAAICAIRIVYAISRLEERMAWPAPPASHELPTSFG